MNCDINQENITRLFAWFMSIAFYKYYEEKNIDQQSMCFAFSFDAGRYLSALWLANWNYLLFQI